jgi:cell wall-associated NlpC family hydrolase
MADHVSRDEVLSWPVQDYSELRSSLRTGDLLFCAGDYLASKMIQQVTRSPWSHVGIVVWARNIQRLLFLESVESVGVRLAPLSKYVLDYAHGKPYDGQLALARSASVTEENAIPMFQFGCDQLTMPYNTLEIAAILARVVFRIGKKPGKGGFICSELVAASFARAGIVIPSEKGGYVTPEDVWRDSTITKLARIR